MSSRISRAQAGSTGQMIRAVHFAAFVALAVLVTANAAVPKAKAPKEPLPPPTHADVKYGPHERHVLDLWLAKSEQPTPLVVFIHGGGFVGGDKSRARPDALKRCLEAGVSFMAVNYRFRQHAPIQEILRDPARAVQFVRFYAAKYNIDAARIACYGASAGAGASLWLAVHDDLADPRSPDPVLR
ncbi:MAG: alpha/beta hydrolase, partial [Verrucomicrobiae bacterium]|nr:alpha/beta hydrolase [Verrucomicrobiae bacterium]